MRSSLPRPVQALHALTRDYPALGRLVDDFLAGRGRDLPEWPPYVLMPMAGWYAIASHRLAGGGSIAREHGGEVSRLAAIGAWRYSQGIYRIAPELMQALLASPVEGTLPTQVLHHLRRGHWHGYWTGPRKGEAPQKFILHWIHPLIAGGNGNEHGK